MCTSLLSSLFFLIKHGSKLVGQDVWGPNASDTYLHLNLSRAGPDVAVQMANWDNVSIKVFSNTNQTQIPQLLLGSIHNDRNSLKFGI